MFPGPGFFVSRILAHISVTKTTGGDEKDNVNILLEEVRERRAKSEGHSAGLRREVAVDWIGEDFHPRPAVGCGSCFRAGELALPHPTTTRNSVYCIQPHSSPHSTHPHFLLVLSTLEPPPIVTHALPCLRGATSEAVGEGEGEEDEEAVSEVVEEVEEEDIHKVLRNRRKRTYWIWPSIWTKRLW